MAIEISGNNLGHSDDTDLIGLADGAATVNGTITILAADAAAATLYMKGDNGDDAGDEWKFNVSNAGVLTMGNDIASAGTHVAFMTMTPTTNAASSTTAFAGDVTVAGDMTVTGTTTTVDTVTMNAANAVVFEGATPDGNETTLTIVDPQGDNTIYLPDAGGYIPLLADATTNAGAVTQAEFALLDGGTAATSTTLVNADRLLCNDNGTMVQVAMSDVKTYINAVALGDANTFTADQIIGGTTPKLTIGDGGAEDTMLAFDGNATDFRIGLDDGTDKVEFGTGTAHGTTTAMTIDTSQQVAIVATTAASSTSTGALTVAGGASVAADLYVGDDLKLASDAALLTFGADSEIVLTHVADSGLTLSHETTGDNLPIILTLESSEAALISGEVVGQLDFKATDSDGSDGALVCAGIAAIAEDTFSATVNSTKLSFKTAATAVAAETMKLGATGILTLNGSAGNLIVPNDGGIGSVGDTNAVTISSGGVVAVTATTAASSTTTGALTVAGGASVAADLYVGDDLRLLSDSAVLAFGADGEITFTHIHDEGLMLNFALAWDNGDQMVNGTVSGQLDLEGATEIQLVAPTVDINASTSVNISNDLKLDSDAAVLGLGADNDVTLTHVADTGLLLNAAMELQFRDSALTIGSSTNGQLDIAADVELEIVAPTVDIDATTAAYITTPLMEINSATSEVPRVRLLNTNADADGPVLEFFKNSSSPADDDVLGYIEFQGDDDAGNKTEYISCQAKSLDVTNGTEDGQFVVRGLVAGTARDIAVFWDGSNGLVLSNAATYGSIKAHSYITYSDETLKSNITPIIDPLAKVRKLQGVSYDWKSDGTADIGFIAQDVEKVLPEVVRSKDGADGSYGMDYTKVTALLTEAIKVQDSEITALKATLSKVLTSQEALLKKLGITK